MLRLESAAQTSEYELHLWGENPRVWSPLYPQYNTLPGVLWTSTSKGVCSRPAQFGNAEEKTCEGLPEEGSPTPFQQASAPNCSLEPMSHRNARLQEISFACLEWTYYTLEAKIPPNPFDYSVFGMNTYYALGVKNASHLLLTIQNICQSFERLTGLKYAS